MILPAYHTLRLIKRAQRAICRLSTNVQLDAPGWAVFRHGLRMYAVQLASDPRCVTVDRTDSAVEPASHGTLDLTLRFANAQPSGDVPAAQD